MSPQAAPNKSAHTNMAGIITQAECPARESAAQVAPTAPRAYCPSAPMFHTCIRKERATPREHKKIGTAFTRPSKRE